MKTIVLLATNDLAVETAVKAVARNSDCELQCAKTTQEAIGMFVGREADFTPDQKLAVVDLDVPEGARTLVRTAGGVLPVIAIASKSSPWLDSLERHHRVSATLLKPVTPEKLRHVFKEVGHITCKIAPTEQWPQLGGMLHRVRSVLGSRSQPSV